MRILIAEDDFTSRITLQGILCKYGHKVITATNGEEAWAALQKTDAPQLAILDWIMPGMDGATLCRKLREQERKDILYLILLTVKGERDDIITGLEAGADDYISKPYDNEELRARINTGIRIITLQNELQKQEKLQGAIEMAGAICHELNQPLQSVSGFSELLLMDMETSNPNYKNLQNIRDEIKRIGDLTRKMMNISQYQSKPYLTEGKIIDIELSSQQKEKGK